MKFALLGLPESGQTMFLASLYRELGKNSIRGYQLHGTRKTDLELSKIWKDFITQNVWPKHDVEVGRYQFDVLADDQIIESLEISSYTFENLKQQGSAAYKNVFISADVLMFVIDAVSIAGSEFDAAIVSDSLQEYIDCRKDLGGNVKIIVTKCDLVIDNSCDEFVDRLKNRLKVALDKLSLAPWVTSAIVPVSAIGKRPAFVPAMIGLGGRFDMYMGFNSDLYNVSYPVISFLEQYSQKLYRKSEHKLWEALEEIAQLIGSDSSLSRLVDVLLNRSRKHKEIKEKIGLILEYKMSEKWDNQQF